MNKNSKQSFHWVYYIEIVKNSKIYIKLYKNPYLRERNYAFSCVYKRM